MYHTKEVPIPIKNLNDPPKNCPICNVSLQDNFLFKVHMKQFHMLEDKYTCPKCPFETKPSDHGMEKFVDHLTLEHSLGSIPLLICDMCDKSFHSHVDFMKHKIAERKRVKKRESNEIHVCEQCGKNFQSKPGLNNHINAAHTERVITKEDFLKSCPKCNQEFYQPEVFDAHLKICLPPNEHKNFVCKFCETTWVSHLSYELHVLVKHEKLKMACDECGNLFDTPENLKMHKKKVHEKSFYVVCHICAKHCSNKDQLKHHLARIHDIGEKKLKCDHCDSKFVTRYELKQHIEAHHNTSMVYQCEECPKIFQVKSYLQTHIRIVHKKHRPHQCDICLERFLYNRDVIRHKKFHHKMQ